MGKMKMFVAALAALAGASVFASESNTFISFSSTGDTYADGTPVIDGEWYVLISSSDGSFGGFNSDGTVAVEGQKVHCLAPLALDGGCRDTFFQITPENACKDGYYAIYLLDTRTSATTVASTKEEVYANLKGWTQAAKGGSNANSIYASNTTIDSSKFDISASDLADAEENPAKITDISFDGDNAVITVENMHPALSYRVKYGASLDDVKTASTSNATNLQGPDNRSFSTKATFIISKEDANFFRVVR